jgi:hypothetical protein
MLAYELNCILLLDCEHYYLNMALTEAKFVEVCAIGKGL